MKIQYISYDKKNIKEIECTTLANPKSFDIFDVNIINLNSQYIWRYNLQSTRNINCFRDLKNLKDIVNYTVKSNIIYILPQNLTFLYGLRNNDYQCFHELKNLIKNDISYILEELLELRYITLVYENNETLIGNIKLESAFHFVDHGFKVLTKSIDSNKDTTIKYYKNNIL